MSLFHNTLGCPVPFDDHAVSVILPYWSHVIGYEEGDSYVINSMKSGYPRFKIHASVARLCHSLVTKVEQLQKHKSKLTCFCFSTKYSAERLHMFLLKALAFSNEEFENEDIFIESIEFESVTAVYFPENFFQLGKTFWQHTGEILSSRQAEDALVHFGVTVPDITFDCFNSRLSKNKSLKRKRSCFSDKVLLDFKVTNDGSHESRIAAGDKAIDIICQRLATLSQIENDSKHCVTLTVSGMASIYAALRLAQYDYIQKKGGALNDHNNSGILEGTAVVVFGFPYLDTLKMMRRPELNPGEAHFFGNGDENDINLLEKLLQKQNGNENHKKIIALFTEFPSNPLLFCPSLKRLKELANKYDFLLVVDDTISTCGNVDLFHNKDAQADIVCSSLTKLFNGRGDVMAGALMINPTGRSATSLFSCLGSLNLPKLYYSDALTLEINSRDFLVRLNKVNVTSLQLVNWFLTKIPFTKNVFYPSTSDSSVKSYDRVMRKSSSSKCVEMNELGFTSGYGCLFSIVFDESPKFSTQVFYDALDLSKGPSLGTNFTLVCPYTLLAHYYELPWAKDFGVDKDLIRISVGLEDIDYLKSRFTSAIIAASHPRMWKLIKNMVSVPQAVSLILEFLYPDPVTTI